MGGCCCCSSRSAEPDRAPVYLYCTQDLEEHARLSSNLGESAAASGRPLLGTTLDTSTPDTYRAPPAPLPYDVGLACRQTAPGSFENSEIPNAVEELDCKNKKDREQEILKVVEDEHCEKTFASATDEEDVCPICLEEYDAENPRMVTKCQHDFHLSCLLEWMERSDTCPVCDQITMIDELYNE
ncbi:probable E3 ubiquitin-protein ligase RHB1A isoform X1 [Typha latifolia]|uniref:probable E3 ubiquitin-protein ligase RHB1A isoform X1 n=1 Tax=Typha latifolia TaxID=4733 RepID=UPI003C2F0645